MGGPRRKSSTFLVSLGAAATTTTSRALVTSPRAWAVVPVGRRPTSRGGCTLLAKTPDLSVVPEGDPAALEAWMRHVCEAGGLKVADRETTPTTAILDDDDESDPLPALSVDGDAASGALSSSKKTKKTSTHKKKSALLRPNTILSFERRGHVCVRNLLSREEVAAFAGPIRDVAVAEESNAVAHAAKMNPGENNVPPFLQTFNAHRRNRAAKRLAYAPRLAEVAKTLLGVDKLRLYQTSIFRKRVNDAATNWHSDLATSPLDANHFVTAWIPLHDVSAGETGLDYADGSHRDLGLLFWYGEDLDGVDASDRYDVADHGALEMGDVSFHHGWTLHSAAENVGQEDRFAFAISYVDADARLVDEVGLSRLNDEDAPSYEAWIHDLDPGDPIDHPLLPLLL